MNIATKQFAEDMMSLAEFFQKDCQATVEKVFKHRPNAQYQDAVNVWLYNKLAEFELRLRQLENVVQP